MMPGWVGAFAVFTAIALMVTQRPAAAENVLERAIGDAQPCRALKVNASSFGISVEVGVDKLDYVKIERLDMSVNGDLAEAKARGTLACKTSDNTLVQGGFSATADVSLHFDLSSCKTTESSFEIIRTSGPFGDIVQGLKDEIAQALLRGLQRNVSKLCQK